MSDARLPLFGDGETVFYGPAKERARIVRCESPPTEHSTTTYRIQFWREGCWTKEDYWAAEEGLSRG